MLTKLKVLLSYLLTKANKSLLSLLPRKNEDTAYFNNKKGYIISLNPYYSLLKLLLHPIIKNHEAKTQRSSLPKNTNIITPGLLFSP